MPEYVYAQHDFAPENPDEVSFKVGDRIEIVEKDELYGDGWWQVSMVHFNMARVVHLRSHLALPPGCCVLCHAAAPQRAHSLEPFMEKGD